MRPYQPLDRSIAGRTAIVTGAASGMGRATAHLFAREGANVVATDRDAAGCDAVVGEIDAARTEDAAVGQAVAMALDVGDPAAIRAVVAAAADAFGDGAGGRAGVIDILVNNAGFSIRVELDDDAYDEKWATALNGMLTAHQRLVRAALPHLRRSDAARVVNIASTEGLGATPHNSAYAVAKHGVIGLTRALATDLGPEGITVNCICPGPIETAITARFPDRDKTIFARRRTALKRYGQPEEVAHMTLSLVLPAASYVTGAALPVDGGLTGRNA